MKKAIDVEREEKKGLLETNESQQELISQLEEHIALFNPLVTDSQTTSNSALGEQRAIPHQVCTGNTSNRIQVL